MAVDQKQITVCRLPTPIPTIWNMKALSYANKIMLNAKIRIYDYNVAISSRVSILYHTQKNAACSDTRLWVQDSKVANGFL